MIFATVEKYSNQNKCCISYIHVCIFFIGGKSNIHLEQPFYLLIKTWKCGGGLFGFAVPGGAQTQQPLNVTSDIFRFDNYCLQLVTMDDFMQLFVPKLPIL